MDANKRRESLTALLIYLPLSLLMTFPVIMKMCDIIPGDGGDSQLFVWNLWWMKHAIVDLHQNPFQTQYIFSPIGVSLVFHTFTPLYGLLSIPLQFMFSPVFCYNVVFLMTFVVTGWGTYFLSRLLGIGFRAAVVAGIAFTFCPARMVRSLGHLNLLSTQWIPLFFVFLMLAKSTGRRRYSVLAGVTLAASFYTGYQLTVMLGISMVLLFIFQSGAFLFEHRSAFSASGWFRVYLSEIFLNYLIVGLVCLMLAGPVLIMAIQEIHWEGNYVSEFSAVESFKTDLVYYVNPFHESLLVRKMGLIKNMDFWGGTEKVLSPGMVTLFLAGLGLFFMKEPCVSRLWFVFWAFLVSVFFVLSLGSHLLVAGTDTGISLPYKWFREIPLIGGVRVPGKLSLFVAFGLSLFAGAGFQGMFSGRFRAARLAGPLIGLLMIVELAAVPFPFMEVQSPAPVEKHDTETLRKDRSKTFEETRANTLRIFQVPFGLDTGFRKVGRDISRDHMLDQVFHENIMLSGHVSRCSEDILEYFNLNPLLNRIKELQVSSVSRAMMVPTGLMKEIAREWIYLTQTDRIIITRLSGSEEYLTLRQYRRLVHFVRKHFPYSDMSGDGSKMTFSFSPSPEQSRLYDFSNHPENDVYVFNRFFMGRPDRFSDRDQIKTWYYFRMFFPGESASTRYITIDYRGYCETAGVESRLDVFLNRRKIAELPYPDDWRKTTIKVPVDSVRQGINTLQLTYTQAEISVHKGESRIPFSIGLVSAGMNYISFGVSQINVPLTDYSYHTRGFNVVYIDPVDGSVLRREVYDTCECESESDRFARDLDKLDVGTIVAAVIHDDASNKYNGNLEKSLQSIGSRLSLRRKFRYAYAIIGVKGGEAGSALEEMDEDLVTLTNGNGVIGIRSVSVHEQPDFDPSNAGLDQEEDYDVEIDTILHKERK